jgi:hypothetical protein
MRRSAAWAVSGIERRSVFKKFSITLVGIVVVGVAIAAALPRQWRVERTVAVNASVDRVHPLINDLKRWQDWSAWTKAIDPQLRNIYEGPQDGVGARWQWLGPTMGHGSMEITTSDPELGITLDQRLEGDVVNSHASLTYAREGEALRVTWVDEGTLPMFGGLFRGTVEEKLGGHLEASLAKLKQLAETP